MSPQAVRRAVRAATAPRRNGPTANRFSQAPPAKMPGERGVNRRHWWTSAVRHKTTGFRRDRGPSWVPRIQVRYAGLADGEVDEWEAGDGDGAGGAGLGVVGAELVVGEGRGASGCSRSSRTGCWGSRWVVLPGNWWVWPVRVSRTVAKLLHRQCARGGRVGRRG